jgi:hypothetical protein
VLNGIEATRLLAGPGVADPVKVLVVTTFNLDEYVYEALRAGASGFLLKDSTPAELIAGSEPSPRAKPCSPRPSPGSWSAGAPNGCAPPAPAARPALSPGWRQARSRR